MRPVSRLSLVSLAVMVAALLHAGAGLTKGTASTLYVKMSGNDSAACTAAAPCRTINAALTVAQAGDTIQLGAGSYPETNGVEITKDVTINGGWFGGTAVKLGWWDSLEFKLGRPVFEVVAGVKVTLKGMTIAAGTRGGVRNSGGLTLENVWIRDNTGGDAINNDSTGSLSLRNVGIDHNSGGPGLFNLGTALLVDVHVNGTYKQGAAPADGIVNDDGSLIMSRGLIAGNAGWGLVQKDQGSGKCREQVLFVNVTISGNAGGVLDFCGRLGFRHVTIAANTAASGGTGGFVNTGPRAVLQNSIVAGNSPSDCSGDVEVSSSLIGDGSCGWPVYNGIDPKLGALAPRPGEFWAEKLFHIGATKVHALLPGSSAIDAASDAYCTDIIFGHWLTDQLGTQRPVDGDGDGVAHCDMGAFEYQPSSGDQKR